MTGRGRFAALAVFLFHAALVAWLLSESLFGGKVLAQLDALYRVEPWHSVNSTVVPQNELLLDQSIVMLPWNDFAAERLRAGELPLWSPYNYAGEPIVAACQSAVWFPLQWLYYLFPSLHTYAWMAAIRLLLTGAFGFLFLRRLGLSALAGAFGATAFMLSGFQVAWLEHPHSNVAMLLPAMLWAVERAIATRRGRDHALFGLFVGLQLVAGHVQTSMHVSLFVALWILFRAFVPIAGVKLSGRGFGGLAIAGVLGAMLAAPQLWPVAEYVSLSQAKQELARSDLIAPFAASDAASLLVAPFRFGAPHTHDWTGPTGPNLNFNELCGGWVGRLALLLALSALGWFGWRRDRRGLAVFFGLCTLGAAAVAWQIDPLYAAARAIPGFAQTKLLRALLFVAFGLATLAAIGLDGILARLPRRRALVAGLALAILSFELLSFARGYNPQVDPALCLPATKTTDFLRAQDPSYRVLAVDNSVLKPNANTFYRVPMLSGYDSVEYREVTELSLRATRTPPDYAFVSRINAFDNVQALPMLSLLGVRWILFKDALPLPLAQKAEVDVYENKNAMPKAFAATALEVIADRTARVDRIARGDFDPHLAILEQDSAEAVAWRTAHATAVAPPKVELDHYAPREIGIRVTAERPELIVVNDAFAPGWHASVRGKDGTRSVAIERVDHALRGIWIQPGDESITLRYDPMSTYGGLVLAGLALAGLLWLCCFARFVRRAEGPLATGAVAPRA